MSYIYLTIGMSVASYNDKLNEVYIEGRADILAIKHSPHEVSSKGYKNRTQLTELFKALDKTPSFQIEWQPSEKYQSTFNNLKRKKNKVKITFYFFERENSATGKVFWSTVATALGATIRDATGNGRQKDAVQMVDVKCDSFKENK